MLMPTVHRFMTMNPYTVGPHEPVSAAHRLMREHGCHHLPVVEGAQLLGVVSDRDLHLMPTSHADPDRIEVGEVMSRPVLAVTPETPFDEAIVLMTAARCSSLVVMGTAGVAGILTATDALCALTDLLRRNVA